MASTLYQLYPKTLYSVSSANGLGSFGWTATDPLAIDDPKGAPNDADLISHSHPSSIGVPPDDSAIDFNLTPSPTAVAITKVTLWARCAERSFNNNTCSVNLKLYVRPAGGTAYFGSAQAVTGTTNAQGYNWQWFSQVWTTNPATGVAWTIEDLNALRAGIYTVDTVVNSPHNSFFNSSSFYVEVEAVLSVFDIEPRRAVASLMLRSFRKPARPTRVLLPAYRADAEVLEEIEATGICAPAAKIFLDPSDAGRPVGGWLEGPGERRDLVVLASEFDPMAGSVEYVCKDMRDEETRLWIVGRQNLGFTLGYEGVPIVHPGAGIPKIVRNQVAYVRRRDGLYVDVPVDRHRFPDDEGWRLEGEQTRNLLLNSSFSQGSGNAFTNWTVAIAGAGSVVQDLGDYLFDVTGLRRSAKCSMGATYSTDYGYVSQAVSVTVGDRVRVRITYKNDQDGSLPVRFVLRRGDTGQDYQWDTGTWGTATIWWPLPQTNGAILETQRTQEGSEMVLTAPASTTLTLFVGYIQENNRSAHVYQTEILIVNGATSVAPAAGSSPVVTTTAALTRTSDQVQIPNYPVGPPWPIFNAGVNAENYRGRIYLETRLLFNHAQLADGDVRVLLMVFYTGRTFHDAIYYERLTSTTGRFYFARRWPKVLGGGFGEDRAYYAVSGSLLPEAGPTPKRFRILTRWTSQNNEYRLGVRQLDIFLALDSALLSKGSGAQWTTLDYTDPVRWTGLQNCVTKDENGLKKSAAGAAWDASARSSRSLTSGNGFIEWTYSGNGVVVGLSSGSQDLTTPTHDGIEFGAVARWNDGVFEVWELGVVKFTGSTMVAGDRLRVAVESGNVKYYVNGVLKYTSLASPSYPLYADAALYDGTAPSNFRQACLWGQSLGGAAIGRELDEQVSQVAVLSSVDQGYPAVAHYQWAVQSIVVLEASDRVFLDEEVNKLP